MTYMWYSPVTRKRALDAFGQLDTPELLQALSVARPLLPSFALKEVELAAAADRAKAEEFARIEPELPAVETPTTQRTAGIRSRMMAIPPAAKKAPKPGRLGERGNDQEPYAGLVLGRSERLDVEIPDASDIETLKTRVQTKLPHLDADLGAFEDGGSEGGSL